MLCFSLKDIFKIKSMMYLRRFRLSLKGTKVLIAPVTNDDVRVIRSRDFLRLVFTSDGVGVGVVIRSVELII